MSQILDSESIDYDLFCLDYTKNDFDYRLPNLPKPIGSADVYRYSKQKLSIVDKVRVVLGSIFRFDVYARLDRVLSETNYDKIIVLQYFLKLSPSVFVAAKKMLWRFSFGKAILVSYARAIHFTETVLCVLSALKTNLAWY
jgi:hypothetical protein